MPVSAPPPDLGKACPDFSLPSVDGGRFRRDDFAGAPAFLVVFTCNHCPYAKAVEDRIIALARAYPREKLQVVFVCANDAVAYPDDAPAKLLERWQAKEMPFSYLYDESQSTARAFGAVCTPDYFLYDKERKLRYRGRLDDNWKEPTQVTRQELREAIDALLAGSLPSAAQNPSMGCSIKWRMEV